MREFWANYYDDTNAIIYVIDSADEKRLNESGAELEKILEVFFPFIFDYFSIIFQLFFHYFSIILTIFIRFFH